MFSPINGWMDNIFGAYKNFFFLGKFPGTPNLQSESREDHIPVLYLEALLKSCWKGELYKEDLCSNFVSLHLFPDCKYLDARLLIEVADGIGWRQTDLLSENLVVKKPLEELWVEETTLKSLFFFSWFSVCYCMQYWRQVFCCDRQTVI